MLVTTITPVRYPLAVQRGINEFSSEFKSLQQKFLNQCSEFEGLCSAASVSPDQGSASGYSDLSADEEDMRLFSWQGELPSGQWLRAHCFNNEIAVIEIDLIVDPKTATSLQKDVQELTDQIIGEFEHHLMAPLIEHLRGLRLDHLEITMPEKTIEAKEGEEEAAVEEKKLLESEWIGRSIRISPTELAEPSMQQLVPAWLKNTIRPQDANEILASERTHSLRWLNYVMVEETNHCDQYKIESMVLAQYFYTVQDLLNRQLFQKISEVFQNKKTRENERILKLARADAQLHISSYREMRKKLTRRKKTLLAEILTDWDFDDLLANADRMIDICSNRLQEIIDEQRERSARYTDYLLVAIGFFSIFDLALAFVSYSREVVNNPSLNYQDEKTSGFISWMASIDIDSVMLFSLLLVVALVSVYFHVKEND